MRINIHAGHNPDGKVACGATGLIKESTEARKVVNYAIKLLTEKGHVVYDCTCSNGTSQSNVLSKIVAVANKHDVDIDVSVHFNAGRGDKTGDGKTGGVEVLIYSDKSKSKSYATAVANKISKIGYTNRGVKIRNDLYVLSHTKSPAMLVECCFVDDADDVGLYDYKLMSKAIVNGILSVD